MEHQTTELTVAGLAREWVTLQTQHERYEQSALLIKLTGVVLAAAGWALSVSGWGLAVLMAVLWLQEGIHRTSQSRLGARLLQVEQGLRDGAQPGQQTVVPGVPAAFQLHSAWAAGRPGWAGLLAEYAASAARPTVAFPHAVLMALALMGGVVR